MPVVFICNISRKDGADSVPSITDSSLQGSAPSYKESVVEGTAGAGVVEELKPAPGDYTVHKRRSNGFYGTDLELLLRSRGIDTLIFTGIVTDGCVAATVQGARDRDFNIIVVSDCCATENAEDDEYFLKKVFPRKGRVRTSDEVIAAIA